jgi:hypothetical protein
LSNSYDLAFEPRLPLMSKIVSSSLFPLRWLPFSYRMLRVVRAQGLTVYLVKSCSEEQRFKVFFDA